MRTLHKDIDVVPSYWRFEISNFIVEMKSSGEMCADGSAVLKCFLLFLALSPMGSCPDSIAIPALKLMDMKDNGYYSSMIVELTLQVG